MSVLALRGISKDFGAIPALSDVSLAVPPGLVIGLMGDNGAGKSTPAKIAGGNIRLSDTLLVLMDGPTATLGMRQVADELRRNLARPMDEVSASKAPLLVTRQGGRSVVVLAEDEYDAMRETLHLPSSPANAARLMRGVTEADAGQHRLVHRVTGSSDDQRIEIAQCRYHA